MFTLKFVQMHYGDSAWLAEYAFLLGGAIHMHMDISWLFCEDMKLQTT